MITLLSTLDAFNNPDSPWYYVVGAAFLLLIFAALAVYIVVSGKRKKKLENSDNVTENCAGSKSIEPDDADAKAESKEAETTEKPISAEINAEQEREQKPERKQADEADKANEKSQVVAPQDRKNPEKPAAARATQAKKSEETAGTKKSEEPEKLPDTEDKPQTTEPEHKTPEPYARGASAAKPKKPTDKPFIDRLIATKSVHGVYNELKNTILSYPGIKARLTKDNEQFYFGAEKKASLALKDGAIEMGLKVDPRSMPAQFEVRALYISDLPTRITVTDANIDGAQKAITFAMNVSMLTKNERHRYTDYVRNAVNAKNRAKKK